MAKKTKESDLSMEERLEQALIPNWDEPYKLPENWCWTHWGNCGKFIAGGTFKEKYQGFLGLPIPFYKVGSLKYSNNKGYLYDETNTIDEEIRNRLKVSLIPVNSIIFAKIGEAIRLNRRSLNKIPCCIDNNLMAFVTSDKCYYKYAYYWSKSIDLYEYANATTIPAIRKSDLESIPFPLAPYETQIKIVNQIESLFAKLDEAKEKVQEIVDDIENRKAAILHKAFSGELYTLDCFSDLDELLSDIFSYRENLIKNKIIQRAKLKAMEDKDVISCFPSNWKQLKLGEIAFVTKLAGFEYTKYIKLEESGEIPVIRAQNVRKGYLDTTNLLYIDRQTSENLSRSALDKPSILITFIGAGIGDVCVFDKTQRFHLAPNVAKVEPYCDEKGAINIRFLLYYLLSPSGQKEIYKSMKAVAQPSLSMETIRDIVIPFTTKEEQDEIVRIVDNLISKVQQAKETAEAVIEQVDMMKKAILARAFRGELGTNDPSEESAVELLKSIFSRDEQLQIPTKKPSKRVYIPSDIRVLVSNSREEEIIKLLLKSASQPVSIQEIMALSSKKFELMDAIRSLEKKQLIKKNESGEYSLTR